MNVSSLSIENVVVYAPTYQALASSADICKFASIPANLKRRCSKTSKIAIETANQAKGQHKIDHAIFCSQHGELDCAVKLLQDIAHQRILSPMEFAQSVHNTAAGLFSVMHNFTQDTVTIAAGKNTFLMGMLETFTWMHLNPGQTLLFVIFDTYIPEAYKTVNIQVNDEYAVAFLLRDDGNEHKSSVSFGLHVAAKQQKTSKKAEKAPAALEFVEWLLHSKSKELIQHTAWQNFKWHKNGVDV